MEANKHLSDKINFTSPSFKKQNTSEIKIQNKTFDENIKLSFETQKIKIELIKKLDCTWREVFEIELNLSQPYTPGDSIGLILPNNIELVNDFLAYCNFKNENVFIVKKRRFSFEGSLFNFFYKYFDFKALPKKAFFYFLSKEANNPYLEYLASSEGEKDYFELLKSNKNLLEILQTYNIKPSLELLIEYGELIKPRYFSLINKESNKFKIVAGLMKNGHFSDFVLRLHKNFQEVSLDFLIKENRLLRLKSESKILCIAAGTGITPFISFSHVNKSIWLIYGCRNNEDDLSVLGEFEKKDVALSSQNKRIFNIFQDKLEEIKYYLINYEIYICASISLQRDIKEFFKNNICEDFFKYKIYYDDWS